MLNVILTNEILSSLIYIEKNKTLLEQISIPINLSNKLRKNTRKRSSYASNRIEGNPLSFEQASDAIDSRSRHFLKPEQEIRNYYLALEMLEKKLKTKEKLSIKMILEVQKQIVEGESFEKKGFRGPMPPGVLFAVYDSVTGEPEYIPPQYSDIPSLMDELIEYVNNSDNHPVIKSAVLHYQLVTIHPFEDGNGRTARILSDYILKFYGYGFRDMGSIEDYISYDLDQYHKSLQMNLPPLYYEGRNNPPHPEIWINYYLRIFMLYSSKVLKYAETLSDGDRNERFSHLSQKSIAFLKYLEEHKVKSFTPIEISKKLKVSNKTIINWSTELCANAFLKPVLVNKRIRSYILSDKPFC